MKFTSLAFLFLWVVNTQIVQAIQNEPEDWFSDPEIAAANSREKDEEALVALFNATNGQNWDNKTGWDGTSMSLDNNIFGVEVEEINGELRVVRIRLNNNGTGDPENNLNDIRGNNLTGILPNELGNLKELKFFNVISNHLTGELPGGMRYCMKMEIAYFSAPKSTTNNTGVYTGKGKWGENLPPEIERISGNFGKWNQRDDFPHNNFTGSLPGEWSDWVNVKQLSIASTIFDANGLATIEGITGQLPPEWGNMASLQQLYLAENRLTGPLPKEWAAMTELVDLYLGTNQLGDPNGGPDAELPDEWGGGTSFGGGMRKLRHLDLSFKHSGPSDGYFGGIWTNSFNGPIPENWGNMKMLHRWLLPKFNTQQDFPLFLNSGDFHNRVVSSNPDPNAVPVEAWAEGLTEITNINNMTNIPDPAKLTFLSRFNAWNNPFDQELPENINEWRRMKQFDVGAGGLFGTVPDVTNWWGTKIFNIQNNNFTGNLPELNTNDSEQRNIQAQNSGFSGAIPESWNFPGNNGFFRLWLHDNNLSGPIPEKLADPGHSYSSGFRVDGNRYVFRDLVPFIALGPNNFTYAPQQAFGESSRYFVNEGGSIRIDDFETVVSHTGNRYQWQKNGSNISGANSRTLTLSSFSSADEGIYTLVVTNPGAPELTLTSMDIELVLGDGSSSDGDNDPVPPDTPNPLNPENNNTNVSITPVFEWSDTGADSYRFQLDKLNSVITIADETVTANTFTVSDDLDYLSDYQWRIKAVKDGVESEWSMYNEFQTEAEPVILPDAPVLASPQNNATGIVLNPELQWEAVNEATGYAVQVSETSSFSVLAAEQDSITEVSFVLEGLDYETEYFWRIRASNEDGEGEWSESWSFTTKSEPLLPSETPALASPENNSTNVSRSPVLSWSTVENVSGYELRVSVDESFSSPVADLKGLSEPSARVENLNYETTYFWQVRAVNDSGASDWSNSWSFTTRQEPLSPPDVPEPASPGNGAAEVSASPEISWNESVDAESYRLQVAGSSNFGQDMQDFQDVQDLSVQVTGLDYRTEYFWRVQAVNGAGTSEWSEIWSFTTREEPLQPPAAPGLVSPENDATNVALSLVFRWNESEDADSYLFQITSSGSSFSSDINEFTDVTSNEMSLDGLEPSTVYNWRVKAVNGAGDSNWSDVWSFSTLAEQDEDDNDGGPGTLPNTDDGLETTVEQNYPNPFNPSTVIQFRLAEQQQVKLKIYNLAGQEVATLVNEALSAGTHERVFDAAGLASGIYFYRLITERNIFTKKMTLIK